jgi:hypothetical protein
VEGEEVIEAPRLSADDLRDELALIHRRRHRTLTTALYAQGDAGEIKVTQSDRDLLFTARPVRCELELRRALADRAQGQNLALLVDFDADRLPADVQGRIAAGRVYPVDRGRRLARLFGASAVSSELLACRPLCELLLTSAQPFSLAFAGATVDLHSAWRAMLSRLAGLPEQGDLSDERLLYHCASDKLPEMVGKALGPETKPGRALMEYLGRVAGPVAPVVWSAWFAGKARRVAAMSFILEVGASRLKTDPGLRATVIAALMGIDPELRDAHKDRPQLLARWGEVAQGLRRRLAGDVAQAVLSEANDLVADIEVAQSLVDSRYLPLAFEVVQRRLARLLAERSGVSPELIKNAKGELERLTRHERSATHEGREILTRARMAVRLLCYRLARPDLEEQAKLHGSNGCLFSLAGHYLSDGAYVDFARDRARGPVDRDLEKAIESVVAEADILREQDDEAFARAYAGWVSSGSPTSPEIVPIAKGLDQFAVEFLKDMPHRRLLVVLLDGMSWANAIELLQDCEDKQYGLLRFRNAKLLPMLAALPSLTGVSRSSLFAGKQVKAGESLDTSKDPERFATHAGLRKIGIENAPLYLKDSVETSSGDLNPKAIELVKSAERVVGLVVNALDDQLKGARQLRVPADLAHIKPLGRLLTEATEANRSVLLIADHGHVRTHRMNSVGRTGDGRRYRYLTEAEAPQPDEVAVTRDVAWVDRGKAKVAMLFRDSDSYGTTSTTGEHGGISLAEIVTPAILVGSEQLRRQVEVTEGKDDPELDISPLPRPDWWELQVAAKPKARATPMSTPPTRVTKPQTGQATLPFLEAPAQPAATESPWLDRLRKSKGFTGRPPNELKRFREIVSTRIAILADAGGNLPADMFARKVGVLPRNLGGVVSEMQEWINFDGYLVVEHDPVSQRVALRVEMLDQYLKEFG